MKLDAVRQAAFRQAAIDARLNAGRDPRSRRIIEAVEAIVSPARSYIVLGDTPEQDADLLKVLVDGHTVVSFELPRSTGNLREIRIQPAADYQRELGQGLASLQFQAALEVAR